MFAVCVGSATLLTLSGQESQTYSGGPWSWKFFIHHQRDEAVGRTLVGATIAAEGDGSHFAIISRVYLLYHGDGPVSGTESFILDKDEVVGGQTSSWSGPFAALGAGGEV